MLKIIVFAPTSTELTPESMETQPIGGADRTFLKMCYALSEKYEVEVYGSFNKSTSIFLTTIGNVKSSLSFHTYMDIFLKKMQCDIFIQYRKLWAIPNTLVAKKYIFYSQDSGETPCFNGARSDWSKPYDKVVVLSQFHKKNLIDLHSIPEDKFVVIGNAACNYLGHEKPKIPRFVFASTPYRGLHILARMWKKIRERLILREGFADVELDVFSSMKIYGSSPLDEENFEGLYNALRLLPGVKYHGSKLHDEVIACMKESTAVLYPNVYPETFCNVIMEARGCGIPFVTSNLGALPETGSKGGILIDGDPYSKEYEDKFLDAVAKVSNSNRRDFDFSEVRTWDIYERDLFALIDEVQR